MDKKILVGKRLLDRDDIESICTTIAKQLDAKFENSQTLPVVVGILKGGAPFMCDIVRKMKTIVSIDFMSVSSYSGTQSTGELKMKMDITTDIKGRDVILVDDVVDTGLTTYYLVKYLKEKRGVKSITTVFLVDKPAKRKYDVPVDYYGLRYEGEDYLIGYGLDYNNLLRNIFGVFLLTKPDIEKLNGILEEDSKKSLRRIRLIFFKPSTQSITNSVFRYGFGYFFSVFFYYRQSVTHRNSIKFLNHQEIIHGVAKDMDMLSSSSNIAHNISYTSLFIN